MTAKTIKGLSYIQTNLNAPKGQFNKFGKYTYRSCEDILGAVKPLLTECGGTLVIFDDIVLIGTRYYVKATAILTVGSEINTAIAFAREPESQKGMGEAQITGSTSSYARKYALNGLFAIDDTADADATNDHGKQPSTPAPPNYPDLAMTIMADINTAKDPAEVKSIWGKHEKQWGILPENLKKSVTDCAYAREAELKGRTTDGNT